MPGFHGCVGGRLQKAVEIGRNMALTGPRVGPAGPTFPPPWLSFHRVSSITFLSLLVIFSGVDELRGKYALESLFSALCKINPRRHKICKLVDIVSLNPILVCIHVLLRV